jgi:undecaprenyl-phosphate galactose phosphotransferase
VPGNSELFVGNIAVELFRSSIPVIAVHQTALIGWGRIVKRFTDLIVGGILLLISLPFILIIGILVKLLDFRGTIFYKDKRLTRFGSMVKVYKFRTMKARYNGLTAEEAFTKMGKPELAKAYREGGDQLPNDPRITTIGRFLRRTSLDEVPQLYNIVKGDISFVGPRALQVGEFEKYGYDKKDLILSVKSGLTGLAQVSGRKDLPFDERRKLDLYYVQNWSLWLDLVILIKTVRVVFGRIGAK